MDIWVIGILNQLFKTVSYTQIKFSLAKLRSLWEVHFLHSLQFVLTLGFDRKILYRNVALSAIVAMFN